MAEKVNILLVDDRPENLLALEALLQPLGYYLIKASSGQEALRCLQNQAVDLVVLDWMIPKEEGPANFSLIRQARPGMPILLCTGVVHADQASDLLGEGGVGMLHKPFRMNELWYAVNNALPGKE